MRLAVAMGGKLGRWMEGSLQWVAALVLEHLMPEATWAMSLNNLLNNVL